MQGHGETDRQRRETDEDEAGGARSLPLCQPNDEIQERYRRGHGQREDDRQPSNAQEIDRAGKDDSGEKLPDQRLVT